jgi:hypothetical protein
MKTVSIGLMREDGDLALFATLNNLDEHMGQDEFKELVNSVAAELCRATRREVHVLEREDAPDYVELNLDNEDV